VCVLFQFDGPRRPGQRDDDVIAVVVVIDSGHPCRIGRTRVGERRNTDEAGKKQEDQGTTYSHEPEPTPWILPQSSGGKTSERRAEKPRGKWRCGHRLPRVGESGMLVELRGLEPLTPRLPGRSPVEKPR
jgi:hypothetical protein